MFPQQDHEAHVRGSCYIFVNLASQANPQGFAMLQAHVQEHVGMLARDQVTKFFQTSAQEAQARGEKYLKLTRDIEAAIAQQIGEILKEVMPYYNLTETRPTCSD